MIARAGRRGRGRGSVAGTPRRGWGRRGGACAPGLAQLVLGDRIAGGGLGHESVKEQPAAAERRRLKRKTHSSK
jgi:hypothetical protein